VVFSLVDDWDLGPLLERSAHQVVAWVRPSWERASTPGTAAGFVRRGLKVLLAQNAPVGSVPPRHDIRVWLATKRIPMLACTDANAPAFREMLRTQEADLFVVATYPQIFKSPLLEIPRLGVINCHPSLLPRYAGAQPGFWVLRNGERETGITVHRMTEKIDAGDILVQEAVAIGPGDNLGVLMQRLHHRAASLIVRAVDGIAEGTLRPQSQAAAERSYFRRKRATDLEINWSEPAATLLNLLRAVQPFEPLTTSLRGRAWRIFDARAADGSDTGTPGEIVYRRGGRIIVQTGKGRLELVTFEIQSLHGWVNWLATQFLVAPGDRFDPIPAPDTGQPGREERRAPLL